MKNEYYQKFTELKKREPKRIELGLVDDLKKLFKKTQGEFKKVDSLQSKLKTELDKALIHTINIDGQVKDIMKQAKILGVENELKEVGVIGNKAEELKKEYKKLYDAIK